jgi:phenylalanyl-tRNA synthetase alpha chain
MFEELESLQREIESFSIENAEQLENFRLTYIAKKGKIAGYLEKLKEIPNEDKRTFGQKINVIKNKAQGIFKQKKEDLESGSSADSSLDFDFSLPTYSHEVGTRHPVNIVKNQMVKIFERIGFNVSYGPEIEDDWHNFTALNFPPDHPAREMQDTFFLKKNPDIALRTHTSSVQVRVMESQKPPIRTISPGRVYRNEAISARAHCMFHQVEGLYIDKNVSFKDLKQTLYYFARQFFGQDTQIRFRPSFFPFTEPSAEIDISCFICGGEGCKICKHTGWVEIGGAGMVDPNVLENCKIDPDVYSGFAFGMGVERIVMLKYQIDDIRLLTENDVRLLRQFKSVI